jgi:hypothetical protein
MADNPASAQPSTTDAVSAVAQGSANAPEPEVIDLESGAAMAPSEHSAARVIYVARRLTRAVRVQPYQRKPDDPVFRPLWIYALDPTQPRLEGAVALVNVPYEPLKKGPKGALLRSSTRQTWMTAATRRTSCN